MKKESLHFAAIFLTCFYWIEGAWTEVVVVYVHDMLLVGNNMDVIEEVKSQLSSKFDMKDLGVANFIMGMEISGFCYF